jgi:DNA-binding NtrC family response regulator
MNDSGAVLIIDDDAACQQALAEALAPSYAVHRASTGEQGLNAFEEVRPDLVLLDVMLPQMGGIAVLRALKRASAELPVIMLTAYAEVQTAVQAIKLGAVDYLQKPVDHDAVRRGVDQAIASRRRPGTGRRGEVIGESRAMEQVWKLVDAFGPTDIPVLLQGETGTGKGVIAQAVHQHSKRARATFVGIDCATLPEQLAESELFGYEDGAFTGAGRKKPGRVAFADRGTLFLDEIGTLPLSTQSKLLTLLEQQNFLPLGARHAHPMHVDVRFVSATNVPLQRAIEEGTFRPDLFYRLNGITIELPPLRERGGDLALLTRHFIAEYGRKHGKPDLDISGAALELLEQYRWPGNVRELQRVVSVAVLLARYTIEPDDLPDSIRSAGRRREAAADPRLETLNLREIKEAAGREAQRRIILDLQQRTNITRQELARILGIDPKTLRSRLKELSIDSP